MPTRVSIVCVEDNPEDRQDVRVQIEDMFANPVTYLSSGEELLAAAASGTLGTPGIILVDLDLSGMSGYELIRRIRQQCKWLDHAYLVVLSNDRSRTAEDTAREVGAQAYIRKPLTQLAFHYVLRNMKPRRFLVEIHDREGYV